jgi:DNA polymerase-1
MILLIDADILLYRAASAVEREIEFEEDIWVLYTDENEAVQAFTDSIADLLERADTYGYLLCFSDVKNFRKNILPEYKGNRTSRKPMGFKAIRERVFKEYAHKIIMKPNLEADDCLGILATTKPEEYVIWSIDKDLKQIPGRHLTEEGIVEIAHDEADFFFYKQVLTGDTTDNYKGCPGIGPVKAESILVNGPFWPKVVAAFNKVGISDEDALVQARCARILRAEDWNETEQEVILWEPTTA